MAVGASLVATLGLDSAKFRKGLDQSSGRLKRFSGGAKKSFNAVGAAFAGLTAVLGTAQLLENADAQIKSADAAGFSFENYQRLRFGYKQAGIEGTAFDKAIVKLNKNIVDGERGLKTSLDNFKDLGVSFEDLQKLSPEERLLTIQEALNGIEDPGRRAQLATDLLGKSFGTTKVDMDDMVEASQGLIPITEETARSAEESNDAFNRLSTNFKNLTTNILGPLITTLTPVVEAFSNFAQEHPQLAQLGVALGAIGAALLIVGGPVTAVAAAVTAAIIVWNNWDEIVAKVTEKWNKFSKDFPIVSAIIKTAVNTLLAPFRFLKSAITNVFSGVKELFSGGLVNGIKRIVNNLVNKIADALEKLPIIGKKAANGFRESLIFELDETKKDALDRSPIPELVDGIRARMSELPDIAEKSGKGFKDTLLGHLDGAAKSTDSVVSGLLDGLQGGVSAKFGGGFLGGLGSTIFNSLISGFRANGGPVSAGGSYVVGEKGPELFTPSTGGMITPNDAMGGNTVNINISGNVDDRAIAQIKNVVANNPRLVGNTTQRYNDSINGLPSRG